MLLRFVKKFRKKKKKKNHCPHPKCLLQQHTILTPMDCISQKRSNKHNKYLGKNLSSLFLAKTRQGRQTYIGLVVLVFPHYYDYNLYLYNSDQMVRSSFHSNLVIYQDHPPSHRWLVSRAAVQNLAPEEENDTKIMSIQHTFNINRD